MCALACPGVYKKGQLGEGTGVCYTYDVLKGLCIEVGQGVNIEMAQSQWEFKQGCFRGGETAYYERARPGFDYTFESIPIEVRADLSPNVGTISDEILPLSDKEEGFSQFALFLTMAAVAVFVLGMAGHLGLMLWTADLPNEQLEQYLRKEHASAEQRSRKLPDKRASGQGSEINASFHTATE